MDFSSTPRLSENSEVLNYFEDKEILVEDLARFVDLKQVKYFAKNHPQGVLVVITNEFKCKYKVICLNAIALHHCLVDECLVEVNLGGGKMWRHYLAKIKYFDFMPCERLDNISVIKDELCSHFASLLLENTGVELSRATRYFFELNIPEVLVR